jgi:hypothetical protein
VLQSSGDLETLHSHSTWYMRATTIAPAHLPGRPGLLRRDDS